MPSTYCDVVIVGAEPAGSTRGALLRMSSTDLQVLITMPRQFPIQRFRQEICIWAKFVQQISELLPFRLGNPLPGILLTNSIALLESLKNNYFVTPSLNKKLAVHCG